jgi:hypothetical protein
VRVFAGCWSAVEGLHLFYNGRRQVVAALRAFIEMAKSGRRTADDG